VLFISELWVSFNAGSCLISIVISLNFLNVLKSLMGNAYCKLSDSWGPVTIRSLNFDNSLMYNDELIARPYPHKIILLTTGRLLYIIMIYILL